MRNMVLSFFVITFLIAPQISRPFVRDLSLNSAPFSLLNNRFRAKEDYIHEW